MEFGDNDAVRGLDIADPQGGARAPKLGKKPYRHAIKFLESFSDEDLQADSLLPSGDPGKRRPRRSRKSSAPRS
jgi:hypothetical protein